MKQYAKAIIGSLIAGLSTLSADLADGSLSPIEWVGVAIAALVALGAIWGVPDGRKPPTP